MTITTEQAEQMAEICDQLGGFAQCAAALRSLAAERDALQAELDQAVGCIEDAKAEREQLQAKAFRVAVAYETLQAENARLREMLKKFSCACTGRCEDMEWLPTDNARCARRATRAALGEKE